MLVSKLRNRWQDLINGFWLIPTLVFLGGPALALSFLYLDHHIRYSASVYSIFDSPSAVRVVISTSAGALISITALVFSLTLVTLQLVSSQFTPRALRGLLSDRLNQFITGGLIGIFAYSQIVVVDVRDATPTHADFVPILSINIAFILSLIGIVLLLIFISHTVRSIQIANIAARITWQTMRSIEHPYPDVVAERDDSIDGEKLIQQWHAETPPILLYARHTGYVQTIALGALRKIVAHYHLHLHLKAYPGRFVTPHTVIAEVWSTQIDKRARIETHIQSCLSIANERDLWQDVGFGVRQLADISLRALSPAVNDPTTAILCIDYLRSLMETIACTHPHTSAFSTYSGSLVVECRPFQEYTSVLLEIGRYATDNARVSTRLLRALERIADVASVEQKPALPFLKTLVEAIGTSSLEGAHTDLDRTLIEKQLRITLQKVTADSAHSSLQPPQ